MDEIEQMRAVSRLRLALFVPATILSLVAIPFVWAVYSDLSTAGGYGPQLLLPVLAPATLFFSIAYFLFITISRRKLGVVSTRENTPWGRYLVALVVGSILAIGFGLLIVS